MSTPEQKSNLARIRDNQRRSRARRREYLQELENRLRICEIQGVEATAEVQAAARRVAEENRHLRDLLVRSGVSVEYIAQYLQSTAADPAYDTAVTQNQPGAPGPATQSLEQAIAPRRPACLDAPVMFPLPSQARRDASGVPLQLMTDSTGWSPSQGSPITPSPFGGHQPVMGIPTSSPDYGSMPAAQAYHPIDLQPGDIARMEAFHTSQGMRPFPDATVTGSYTPRSLPPEAGLAVAYPNMSGSRIPTTQSYTAPGG